MTVETIKENNDAQWRIQEGAVGMRPPMGPDSFVLTYKFFETRPPRELVPPLRGRRPPTGNLGSATDAYRRQIDLRKFAFW